MLTLACESDILIIKSFHTRKDRLLLVYFEEDSDCVPVNKPASTCASYS